MRNALLNVAFLIVATAAAAVPEPDVVFYGHVTRSPLNTAYVPAGVTWSLSGNAETLAVSQTMVVSVNGETFYLTRIPFETRQPAGSAARWGQHALPVTPDTLSLHHWCDRFRAAAKVRPRAAKCALPPRLR